MSEKDLIRELFTVMSEQQEKYREWLLQQPPEEILNHAYEDVCCRGLDQVME